MVGICANVEKPERWLPSVSILDMCGKGHKRSTCIETRSQEDYPDLIIAAYGGERISVQKQCDVHNKLRLFQARQEVGERIREFEHRLRMLEYACNFTTKCPSQSCT